MIIKKINSLITLLDDPNEIVYEAVSKALLTEDCDIVGLLQKSLETIDYEPSRSRLIYIIKRIEFHQCRTGLLEWIEDGADDLLYGAYLVSKLEYPDLDFYHLAEEIDAVGANAQKSGDVKNYLFEEIKKNEDQPLDFHNNFLPDVLHSHKGNKESLNIIYQIICERLSIKVEPIDNKKLIKSLLQALQNSFHQSNDEREKDIEELINIVE